MYTSAELRIGTPHKRRPRLRFHYWCSEGGVFWPLTHGILRPSCSWIGLLGLWAPHNALLFSGHFHLPYHEAAFKIERGVLFVLNIYTLPGFFSFNFHFPPKKIDY